MHPDTQQQLEVFPTTARLRRCNPQANMKRFYAMSVQPDLFGGCVLIREWGRIGSPGRVKCDHFDDEGQAVDALAILAQQKRRRGYEHR